MSVRYCIPLLVSASLISTPEPSLATTPANQDGTAIVLIAGDDPGQLYVQEVYEGFREVLDASAPRTLLFREFFDVVRFGDRTDYAVDFRRWLDEKYRGRLVNVLVATQPPTIELLRSHKGGAWRDVPLVYATIGQLNADTLAGLGDAQGVTLENPFPDLLALITRLLPGTKRIALIRGASQAERARDARYPDDIRHAGLRVTDLGEATIEEIGTVVRRLPPDTVPILVGLQVDGAGRTLQPNQAIRVISRASNRPVFSMIRSDLGAGAVGGLFFGARLAGRELATAALARLEGRHPSSVVIHASQHATAAFDARELDRWGIAERSLPPGSTVLFRAPDLWRDHRGTVIGATAVATLQALLIIGILVQRRRRATAQHALAASYSQLRHLADRLITAQEEERARIARNLHDDVGQRVASLSMSLSGLKRLAGDRGDVREAVSTLQQEAAVVAGELRDLSHELHPAVLEHLGLIEALRAICDEWTAGPNRVTVRLDVSPRWREVSNDVALCLYRVVQEALRNVTRHADARNVAIELDRNDTGILLKVVDDGRGFDPAERKRGLGLLSLDERVQLMGGRLQVASAPGSGTTVTVSLREGISRAA